MSVVNAPNSTGIVQFQTLDAALAGGDMEAVMLMLGMQNAKTQEDSVKTQITNIQNNNAKLRDLDALMKSMLGTDDKKGSATALTDAQVAELRANGVNVDASIEKKDGAWKLKDDGKLDLMRQSLQKTMDGMSSDDQLNMISLQSAVSKQNNAVEMMSTILKKFADLKDSIVRNF